MEKIRINITMTEEQANWFWQAIEGLTNGWEEQDEMYRFFMRVQGTILRRLTTVCTLTDGDSAGQDELSTPEGDPTPQGDPVSPAAA